ncbi:hypothetical protein LCGC14_1183200 [marine sediment metagenome]|uniref:Uncharacterized protein n=1 Tax=marine sediment metagenome TaxID=412755 RepID=A0A0F9LLP5_9ZZZZ
MTGKWLITCDCRACKIARPVFSFLVGVIVGLILNS